MLEVVGIPPCHPQRPSAWQGSPSLMEMLAVGEGLTDTDCACARGRPPHKVLRVIDSRCLTGSVPIWSEQPEDMADMEFHGC